VQFAAHPVRCDAALARSWDDATGLVCGELAEVGVVMAGSAVRNRSEILTLATARGPVQIARQQWRFQRRNSRWEWVWVARRRGQVDWRQAPDAREAIRQATLLAAGRHPTWLSETAEWAERELLTPSMPEGAQAGENAGAS
jgi:hypothetical protein